MVLFNGMIFGGTDALPVYFPRLLLSISSLIAQIYVDLSEEDKEDDEEVEESVIDFAMAASGKEHVAMRICLSRIMYDFIAWLLDEKVLETDDSKQIWYKTDVILEKFIEFQEEEND